MKRTAMRAGWLPAMLIALLALAGCSGGEKAGDEKAGGDGDEVLVTVGGTSITKADFEAELDRIPPYQRREMESPQGKQKFLDRLVEMELLYQAALADGLEKDPDTKSEMERARRQILMRHYYKTAVQDAAQPSEEQIQKYYDEHPDEFGVKERVRARWILAETKKDAQRLADRLEGGADFAELAREDSKDAPTANEDGDLGWFTRDGYVRSLGVNEDFTDRVFALKLGAVSAPIEVDNKGWALVRVDEHEDARSKTLAEVRGDIARRLAPKAQEDLYADTLKQLRERFGVKEVAEPFTSAATPEELFEMAQNAKDPHERIEYYQQMVERFPDFEQADRAMFMVGFVYSEELADTAQARAAFERFLEKYPESDLVEDAHYMLGALSGTEPPFQTE